MFLIIVYFSFFPAFRSNDRKLSRFKRFSILFGRSDFSFLKERCFSVPEIKSFSKSFLFLRDYDDWISSDQIRSDYD